MATSLTQKKKELSKRLVRKKLVWTFVFVAQSVFVLVPKTGKF